MAEAYSSLCRSAMFLRSLIETAAMEKFREFQRNLSSLQGMKLIISKSANFLCGDE